MRVLITGATGFVGRQLVNRLVADRLLHLRAAVRSSSLPVPVESVVISGLMPDTDWRAALDGMDAVIHLAARVHVMRDRSDDPLLAFRQVNVAGTDRLARQAADAGAKRLVFLSSVKVNGESGVCVETDAPAPKGPYAISKLEAEEVLRRVADETGLEVVIVRPPLIYGPGVKANFHSLIRAVALGLPLPLGAIHNRRSLVGVDNLVDFLVTCLEHPAASNETLLVSDGEDLSTTDLVRRIGRALGRRPRLIPVPAAALHAAARVLGRGDVAQRLLGSLQLDISKARRTLGWTPPYSVDEGLRRIAGSMRTRC